MIEIPWFKVDDKFHSHPKVMDLTSSAVGLWALAGSWCADYLTDGEIKRGQIRRLGGSEDEARELVEAGLWEEAVDGYTFRDWSDYQPMRDDVLANRKSKSEGAAEANHRRWHTARGVVSPDCPLCQSTDQSTDRSTDQLAISTPVSSRSVIDPPEPEPVPTNTPPSSDTGFEEWWKHYPKKVDKGDARKAYTNALTKTTHQTLVDGAQGYAHFCESSNRERQYMKGPARWLNVEGWANEDELDTPKQHKPSKWDLPPEAYMHPEEVEDERRRAEQQQRNSGAR